MEELSSFAISIAANIVCSLFPKNTTEREVRKAFEEAVEDWCPNEDIRRHREKDLKQLMLHYIAHPNLTIACLDKEMQCFIEKFQSRIAEHPAAANYLSEIRSKEYHTVVYKGLHAIDLKLEHITQLLEDGDVRNEELHDEAVVEMNTVIEETVIEKVKVILDGFISMFERSLVTYELTENKEVILNVDAGSRWLETEDGDLIQSKHQDWNYDWNMEKSYCWHEMSEYDISKIIADAFLVSFQIIDIEFRSCVEQIKDVLNQNTINEQLCVDERKQINYIIQNLRALQTLLDDHKWIFVPTDLKFKHLFWERLEVIHENEYELGKYAILYKDNKYSQIIGEILAPLELEEHLLDVWIVNPDFHYKLSGHLSELIASISQWWHISKPNSQS